MARRAVNVRWKGKSVEHQGQYVSSYQTALPYQLPTPVRTIGADELNVTVKSFKMTWGNMFAIQFKFWVVATIYSILIGIVWLLFWAIVVGAAVD